MDNKKTTIEVISYKIYFLFRDIGGIIKALTIILGLFGSQFSGLLFKASIAEKNFLYRGRLNMSDNKK